MHRAEERNVSLPQLEDGARADGPGEHRVTDEGPGLTLAQFSIILKQNQLVSLMSILILIYIKTNSLLQINVE